MKLSKSQRHIIGKAFLAALFWLFILVALVLNFGCTPRRETIELDISPEMIEFFSAEAYTIYPQQDTITYVVDTTLNDHQVLLRDSEDCLIVLEVENAKSYAYERGLTITIIKL